VIIFGSVFIKKNNQIKTFFKKIEIGSNRLVSVWLLGQKPIWLVFLGLARFWLGSFGLGSVWFFQF